MMWMRTEYTWREKLRWRFDYRWWCGKYEPLYRLRSWWLNRGES